MSTSFSVTSSQHSLELDEQGQGEAVFTVTNTTDRPKRAQLKVYVQDGPNKSWLTVDGDPARDFAAKGSQQVSVMVKVPAGNPSASYTFRLHAISSSDPQGDYAEGPWITMEVLEAGEEPDKPVPMGLIIGLVVGALAIIGIVVAVILMSGNGEKETVDEVVMVEDVQGKPIGEAKEILEGKGFVVKRVATTSDRPQGEVLAQDTVNTEEGAGTTITLTVAMPRERGTQSSTGVPKKSIPAGRDIGLKDSVGVEVKRYPTVEAPSQVAKGREFAVQVWLSEELLTPEVSPTQKTFSLPAKDKWEIDVILSGRGFDYRNGGNTRAVTLPRIGDSTTALFYLTAQEVGEPNRRIYASFYYKSRFLFRVARTIAVLASQEELSVGDDAKSRPVTSGVVVIGGMNADLSIEIVGGRILIHGKGFVPTNVAYHLPAGLPVFLQEKYARLASLGGRGVMLAHPQSSKDTAKGIGREVYKRFAPESFKNAFWAMVDRWGDEFRSIQIYSDDPLLPWELMVPVRTNDSMERSHLGLEFEISRWHARQNEEFVSSPSQHLDVNELVLVAPRYEPPLNGLENEIQSIQSVQFTDVRLVATGEEELRGVFSQLPNGILHFAGHGVIQNDTAQGTVYSILLEDNRQLTLDQWQGMLSTSQKYHGFVFFNACNIGRTRQVVNFVDGWAPAILDTGASAYLGALWPVSDEKAALFASRFYEVLDAELKRGDAHVLSALTEARKLYDKSGDPTYLAYVYYGDSQLKMSSRARPEIIGQ